MYCAKCKQPKQSKDMQKNSTTASGYGSYCKRCASAQVIESRIRNGWVPYVKISKEEELKRKRESRLKRKFNLTELELATILQLRETGCCEICGERPGRSGRWQNLHVDHDHTTGKFRGLLCAGCNRAIGFLNDSIERAEAVVRYLKRHGGKLA